MFKGKFIHVLFILTAFIAGAAGNAFADPVNDETNPKAIPGAVSLYTITATNEGLEAIDNDTVVITDPVPENTELFVGDINGPGSGPVQFIDGTTASGLTYTFTSLSSTTDDVDFSNDGGSTYTYTPVPDANDLDGNVTDLKINPSGIFSASDGVNDPNFSLKFKIGIQ